MKPVYIKGTSAISPQNTFKKAGLENDTVISQDNLLRCVEPSYSEYLNPVMARRMGRIIKMGIASALECLKDANIDMPGAIITGTALGCLGETEKFLTSVIEDDEQFLTPTHFIQSIQNTVSGQIALQLKCTNHNFTFVHKGFSFESALIDALMMLNENEANDILVGGLDEMTEKNFIIYNKLGNYKKENIRSADLLKHKTPGSIGGEGSCFFVLSNSKGDNEYASLRAVKTIYNPVNASKIEFEINTMLTESNFRADEISFVLYGYNGDPSNDKIYDDLRMGLLKNTLSGYFKHLCGEYQTSGAFALWLGAMSIKNKHIPERLFLKNSKIETPPENILIVNNYENNFCVYLVSSIT